MLTLLILDLVAVQQGVAISEDYYSSEGYWTEHERFYWIFHCCSFTTQVFHYHPYLVPFPTILTDNVCGTAALFLEEQTCLRQFHHAQARCGSLSNPT